MSSLISEAKPVFAPPQALFEGRMHYCPGCTHGIIHRLIAEVMDEMELTDRAVGIASVGCSVFIDQYFNCDVVQAAHGRSPAVATGLKRALPDSIIFAYQGDGDLASIGIGEIIHAAARGEKITVFFINNAVFGMTGGQLAPTTILGQKTSTSPLGRNPEVEGNPIRVCEMLATLQGPAYLSRVTVTCPKRVREAKRAIRQAFRTQVEGKGFALVELISTCPTRWKMSPEESCRWVEENMLPCFPLGEFVNWEKSDAS